jgi:hypothetical protein
MWYLVRIYAGWTFKSHERLAQVIVDKIKAKILVKSKLKLGNGLRYWGFFQIKNPKVGAWYGKQV